MEKLIFKIGQTIQCTATSPLPGNDIAPPLEMDGNYTILNIVLDSQGNQHLDVGLPSECYTIRSYETKEYLPNGDKIHWCHPSRFLPINK